MPETPATMPADTATSPQRRLLLLWLIYTGLIAFAAVVAWNEGYIDVLIATDQSRLCIVIGLLYLFGTGHCARQAAHLARELDLAGDAERRVGELSDARIQVEHGQVYVADTPLPDSFTARLMADAIAAERGASTDQSANPLAEIYAAELDEPRETGWFLVDALIKLGLLGTIIGFILMLGSVSGVATLENVEQLGVENMREVLRAMSAGMKTALFTTLAGLTCSMSLAVQYRLLDRGASELLRRGLRLVRVRVLPRLA